MRVLLFRVAVLLCFVFVASACHEQSSRTTVDVPGDFELDFDQIFNLKAPCALTPELLEAKVRRLEVVPREHLVKTVTEKGDIRHLFSAAYAPVHNPSFTIFKSSIRPTLVSVVWQGLVMERFYCVYPAEKDQAVPPELLSALDSSLGVTHTINAKKFEWDLANYSVSAEYSTHVGEGGPAFLVNVRNKNSTGAKGPSHILTNESPMVNLDDLFEWKNPMSMTVAEFQSRVEDYEKASMKKVRVSDRPPHYTYYFDQHNTGPLAAFKGRFVASNAYFQWTNGKISDIRVSLPPLQNGKHLSFSDEVAYLDSYFGMTHDQLYSGMEGWRWPGYQIRFYKYSNSDSFCLELDELTSLPVASASSASSKPVSALPTASPTPAAPSVPAVPAPSSSDSPFKLRLTQVNGLLISQLASGEEAGQVTKMTLTALPSASGIPSKIEFNQSVGQDMLQSLNEVHKLAQLRHSVWPNGHRLQIGFEDKYIAKDGPSAAVACALLVESSLTGQQWDPAFAVTGDLNADGSVQPIGGVRAKVRGATKGSCRIVAVPAKNETSIPDMLLLDGPAPLIAITVFGIKSFDEALTLAKTEKPKALGDALLNFEAMRPALLRDPRQILPLLRTPQGMARLQALLQAAPNCYSAKYLLLYAQGRSSRSLTIGGSIEAAQSSAQAIVNSIDADVDASVKTLKPDELGTSLNKLRNLRPMLDRRVWPYVDGLVAYGEVIRGAIMNPIRSGARYVDVLSKARNAASSVQSAFKSLMSDPAVREEMGL